MIEKILLDYLNERLSTPVYTEERGQMPEKYVLIDKTGGGGSIYLKEATIAIQSYGKSLYEAAALNEQVKEKMNNVIELDDISKCSLNSDYEYTDTTRKKYRYQAVFDLVYF